MSERFERDYVAAQAFRLLLVWFGWHLISIGILPCLFPDHYDAPALKAFVPLAPVTIVAVITIFGSMMCNRPRAMAVGSFVYACMLALFVSVHPSLNVLVLYVGFASITCIHSAILIREGRTDAKRRC